MSTNIVSVKVSDLVSDMAYQPRVGLDHDHVESMVRALNDDLTVFDDKPIQVWRIAGKLWIVDGHHRHAAFKSLKKSIATIGVVVNETVRDDGMTDDEHIEKSRSEALQYAIKANLHHGSPLKRSRKDNQRAVELLLGNPTTRQLSDSMIAELVGVSGPTVAKIRKSNPEYQSDSRVTADGRVLSAEKQSAGVEKRKKSEPARHEEPVEGGIVPISSSVTSVMVERLDDEPADHDEPELTPEQVEERRRKFLDELSFEPEELLDPGFEFWTRYPKDNRGRLINIDIPDEDADDYSWIDDRKLCSAVLDSRIYDGKDYLVAELVRRFLKLANQGPVESPAVEPETVAVGESEPAVEPVPAVNGKPKFDWSTHEGIRESMRYTISQGFKYPRWCQNYRLPDKREKFPAFPDDATLKNWFAELSA